MKKDVAAAASETTDGDNSQKEKERGRSPARTRKNKKEQIESSPDPATVAYEVSDPQQRTEEATVVDLVRAIFVLRAAQEKTRQGHGLWFRRIGGDLANVT